jgi:SAM-dependent methyltransferase
MQRRAQRPILDAWQGSLNDSVVYWDRLLANVPEHMRHRLDPDHELQPEIASLIDAPKGSTVRILDCGAGPLTFIGKRLPDYTLEVEAADALGNAYNDTLDRLGITPPVRTQQCETEHLSEVFTPNSFDIVYARNTLDHSHDPVRAIREMLACAKPGGVAVLAHVQDVGVLEKYIGMHQWNFHVDGNTVRIWRPGTSTDLSAAIDDLATIERTFSTVPIVEGANVFEHVVLRKRT